MTFYNGQYIPEWLRLTGTEDNRVIGNGFEITIEQYLPSGEFIASYGSIAQAARETEGVTAAQISQASLRNRSAGGYIWRRS